MRNWLNGFQLGTGLKECILLEEVKEGGQFDLVCRILQVSQIKEDEWMRFIWDGSDAPTVSMKEKLEDEAEKALPLQVEPYPLSRDTFSVFPVIGTVFRVAMAQASEKLNIDSIKIGKWARFTRIRFEVLAGLLCGLFTTFTKMQYLSVEDPLIMQRQSSYDERATTFWRRMPQSAFPWPSRATVTDHGHATFATLMVILTYSKGRGGPGMVTNTDIQNQNRGLVDSALQPIGLPSAMAAASVMAGTLGSTQIGSKSSQNGPHSQLGLGSDPLTLHLAKMSRNQLNEILSELKVMATQNKDLARRLLVLNPQLSKALFQAEIMLGLVPPQTLHAANLHLPSSTLSQPILQGSQQIQQSSVNAFPSMPQLATNNMQLLLPKTQGSQVPIMTQNSLVPNRFSSVPQAPSQNPQLVNHQVLPQVTLPAHALHGSQALGHLSVRPELELATSLKQQMQPLPQKYAALGGARNPGRISQMPTSSGVGLSSVVRPHLSEINYKPLTPADAPVTVKTDADGSARVADGGTNLCRRMGHDLHETTGRPSKQLKLNDGRSTSFSASLPVSARVGQSEASENGLSAVNPNLPADELQHSQKQLQLLPETESALLQQVLNLTPEQLSSLPPEQREQVVQLQQMLR